MDTIVLLAGLTGAAAAALLTYSVWTLVTADRERVAWRVSRTGFGVRRPSRNAVDVLVRGRTSAIFTPVDRALSKYGWAERGRAQLQKAEVNLHLSEFIAIRILATLTVFLVPAVIALSIDDIKFLLGGITAAAVVWWQIGAFVRRRISKRQRAIESQLDEALVGIAGSLRAGFSFLQACQMSVNQLQWPLRNELQEMLADVNVGASLDDALRHLAERVDVYDVDIAVNAVLVQRQVGGSLAEILDNVAKTIRQRRELRGQIMALTAQQRLSGYIVAGVPVFMAILLSITSWQFMKPLWLTLVGNVLLVVAIILDMVGFLIMRRLTKIDF